MKSLFKNGGLLSFPNKNFFLSNKNFTLKSSFIPIRSNTLNPISFQRNINFVKETRVTILKRWIAIPKPSPITTPKSTPQASSRSMATHRDLGYGGNNNNRNNFNWGRFTRYKHIIINHKTPILFTLAVLGGTTFILPYIFKLPVISSLKKRPELIVYSIMAINLAGFLAWKTKKGSRFMYRYGLLHKDNQFTKWSMIGSAFSHQEFWHIGINMYVLYNFGTTVATWIGSEQFLAAYIDGAVVSSLCSLLLPVFIRRFQNIPSLGASGAVFTTFGIFSYLAPQAKLALMFIPLPFGAFTVFLGTVAYNAAGMFMRFGGSDYAGHLGGSIMGLIWGYYLTQKARRARERRRVSYSPF